MTDHATVAANAAQLEQALFEVKKVIVGQDQVIERLVACLLARGHCLLEGVPGLAKTLAVETLAEVVGGTFVRLQFTPDLIPSDLTGTRIYRQSSETFDVQLGPVFANFVLADEINRAPAKVQSALLEVMAERQVSIGGATYEVPEPFLVMATQNPIESEGVYPLPEAQRDRFLMKVLIDYPSAREEGEIVRRMSVDPPSPKPVLAPEELIELQRATDRVFVHDAVVDYAVRLVVSTREPAKHDLADVAPQIAHGASPRATLGLVAAGRALALLRRRDYVLPQDIYDVARDVFRHRVLLSYEALADGVTPEQIVERVVRTIVAPRITPGQDGEGLSAAVAS
ncbi:MAG TPA: MoxR family ATPase [Acidimicrobiales bacterium]|nr:MoxR family ATPase [Acidimicrobiales bacterium]